MFNFPAADVRRCAAIRPGLQTRSTSTSAAGFVCAALCSGSVKTSWAKPWVSPSSRCKNGRGANRVGVSRLFELSRILDVPVSFFYDDMLDSIAGAFGPPAGGFQDGPQASYEANSLNRRETLELVHAYYRITNPKVRERLFELTKSLGKAADGS